MLPQKIAPAPFALGVFPAEDVLNRLSKEERRVVRGGRESQMKTERESATSCAINTACYELPQIETIRKAGLGKISAKFVVVLQVRALSLDGQT